MTNEQVLTMLEHAIEHLRQSNAYWDNEDYLPTERAILTLQEAKHHFVCEHVGMLAYRFYCAR